MGFRNPIALIPNGVTYHDWLPDRVARAAGGHVQRLLFLGRIHPKKGLTELLRGWSAFRAGKAGSSEWCLDIVGWGDEEYVAHLKSLVEKLGVGDSVSFLGPRFGREVAAAYFSADAFVLTSHSEGMPMSVLEAWAAGLPVIMTPECGLPEGFGAGAAISTSCDPNEIASAIRAVADLSCNDRVKMGDAGRRLVSKYYSWPRAAESFEQLYQWLTGVRARPDFVLSD
jgi:poly(glycerol-phosphate) alpha-glucosyltransferase